MMNNVDDYEDNPFIHIKVTHLVVENEWTTQGDSHDKS